MTEGRNQQPVLKINKIIQLRSIVCTGELKKNVGEVLWVGEGLTERCQRIPSKDDSDE